MGSGGGGQKIKYTVKGVISDGKDTQEFTEANILNIQLQFGTNEFAIEHKLQKIIKDVPNLKSLIHSITQCAADFDEIHAKRYEEELFAYLDDVQDHKP